MAASRGNATLHWLPAGETYTPLAAGRGNITTFSPFQDGLNILTLKLRLAFGGLARYLVAKDIKINIEKKEKRLSYKIFAKNRFLGEANQWPETEDVTHGVQFEYNMTYVICIFNEADILPLLP